MTIFLTPTPLIDLQIYMMLTLSLFYPGSASVKHNLAGNASFQAALREAFARPAATCSETAAKDHQLPGVTVEQVMACDDGKILRRMVIQIINPGSVKTCTSIEEMR